MKAFKFVFILLIVLSVSIIIVQFFNKTIIKSKAAQSKVSFSFNPASGTIKTGEEKKIILLITPDSTTKKISGVNLVLEAEGNLKIVKVSPPTALGGEASLFTEISKDIKDSKASVSYVVIKDEANLPKTAQLDVIVKGNEEGEGTLRVNGAESQIVGNIPEINYDSKEGAVANFSFSSVGGATPGETGSMTLNLKLRFQGIVEKPSRDESLLTKVTIDSGSLSSPIERETEFTVDDEGVWSGSVSFDGQEAEDYRVLIKGPMHLQKRICEDEPEETHPGTYSCAEGKIALKTGENDLDFSNIIFFTGDLPGQDGVVNSYDVSLVTNNLGKTDEEALKVADINLDGLVNTQDYALVISALSIRSDEVVE